MAFIITTGYATHCVKTFGELLEFCETNSNIEFYEVDKTDKGELHDDESE